MHKHALLAVVLVLFAAGPALGADDAPRLVVDEPDFTFGKAVDGIVITHAFVIRNQSKAPLVFGKASSDCGCTVATIPTEIPAGGQDRIIVKFDTAGYGGRVTRHRVRVDTNDPQLPKLELSISGEVREFASVLPRYVTLRGKAGTEVGEIITILPMQPFTIRGVRAQEGKNIRVSVNEKNTGGRKSYVVTVENTLKKPGWYMDVIIVETDSTIKPEITIGVRGEIFRATRHED